MGPASNFPVFRKMHVMSIAKQKQNQESYFTYTSENKDQQKLPSKIFLEEFKSDEALIISISLQIANVHLLFYALFLSVNANEGTICICIIWAELHMRDDALCINLPASFLSASHI